MKLAVLSITRRGIALGGRVVAALPGAVLHAPEKFRSDAEAAAGSCTKCYGEKTGDHLGKLFAENDAVVAILSLGALVRMCAPYLKAKDVDPAIVVLDESGRFAIPVLSGHLGGANALAGQLAAALGVTPVLTTASDVQETIGVDILGRELGWALEADHDVLLRASAAVVNEDPVALVQEAGSIDWWSRHANGRQGPLPANIHCFARLEDIDALHYAAVLWISHRPMPDDWRTRLAGRCVIYRPPASAEDVA